MTTEPRPGAPGAPGTAGGLAAVGTLPTVARCAAVVLAAGMGATALGAVVAGRSAALGSAAGTTLVLVFFCFGSISLAGLVRALPALALPLALLTFTFQVVVVGAAALLIDGSRLLGDTLDGGWLGLTMIVLTLMWVGAQVAAAAGGGRDARGEQAARDSRNGARHPASQPSRQVPHGGW